MMQNQNKTILLLTLFLFMGIGKLLAQQDFINGFYMYNPLGFNPAIVGTDDRLVLSAIYRNQWTGIEGAPETMYANIHSPLANLVARKRKKHNALYPTGISLGLTFAEDDIGANMLSMLAIPIGVRVRINSRGDRLSFGVKPMLNIFSSDNEKLRQDPGDGAGQNWTETFVDFDLGWYYYNKNYYVGLSISNVREIDVIKEYGYYQRRHYFASAGFAFFMSNKLMLRTTTLVAATEHAPVSVTLSPTFIINQRLYLGAAYRYEDMVGANVAVNITKNLRAGYVYEYPLGTKTNRIGYTHEIMLTYAFTRYRNQVISPRFFW